MYVVFSILQFLILFQMFTFGINYNNMFLIFFTFGTNNKNMFLILFTFGINYENMFLILILIMIICF